jgi:hypothetical protein
MATLDVLVKKLRASAPVLYPGHDRPVRFEKGRVTYLVPAPFRLRCIGWSDPEDEYGVCLSVPLASEGDALAG